MKATAPLREVSRGALSRCILSKNASRTEASASSTSRRTKKLVILFWLKRGIGKKYAIKAIDKKRVQDYETFVTEVKVLKKTVISSYLC